MVPYRSVRIHILCVVTAHAILPLTPTPEQSFFRSLLDLSLPFMVGVDLSQIPQPHSSNKI